MGARLEVKWGPVWRLEWEPVPTRLQERRNELAGGRRSKGGPAAVSRGGAHLDPASPPATALGVRGQRWAALAR